ncbi:MAG: shikimate dehydrogenase [Desulfobacterium sp.]|nr:shikimate dehydrogenase [Desulfobacterium sp.]
MLNSDTRLYALFGDPVSHSLGPVMHNAAFKEGQINAVYLAFRVSKIEQAVDAMRNLKIAGASITIPHKETVIPFLDEMDDLARDMGAVNTIVNRDGTLVGYNTDARGAVDPLGRVCDLSGKRVVIVGAGGAARAVAFGVKQKGAALFMVNRSEARGRALADEMGATFIYKEDLKRVDPEIIINATSLGMAPKIDDIPLDPGILKPSMIVMDIVYTPVKTALIRAAMEKGCVAIDGLSMFVNQGAAQFELFTGTKAPEAAMKKSLIKVIENR